MDSIWKSFYNAVKKQPEKTAIICGKNEIKYQELEGKSENLSQIFYDYGIRPGDQIGLWMMKSIDYAVAMLAILRLGATVVPLSTYYNHVEAKMAYDTAQIKCLIINEQMREKMGDFSAWDKRNILCLPSWTEINHREISVQETTGQICLFLLTSGSTGQPKVAVISQQAMLFRLELECQHFDLKEDYNVLISTPIYHSLGIRILMMGLSRGMSIVLTEGFSPKQWLELIQCYKINYTITVPSQIAQILEYLSTNRIDVSKMLESLRVILSTSAYLPPKTKQEFLKVIKGRFVNFIASSETEFIAWSDCRWEDPDGNLLGEPFPQTELYILKNGKLAEQGETGEIICKSHQLFDEYYNNEQLTNHVFWNGFYKTGDLGYFDSLGRLHFAGRQKNVIICSGVNIVPRDIEQVLIACPGVEECVAFGVPHDTYGEVVAVLITGNNVSENDIKRFALKNLTLYQQPRKIFITDHIPKNEMGKIALQEILDLYKC